MVGKEESGLSSLASAANNPLNFTLTPHMHIQIFDGANKQGSDQHGGGSHNNTARPVSSGEGEVQLDRVKLSKWPSKSNAKRDKALKALRK